MNNIDIRSCGAILLILGVKMDTYEMTNHRRPDSAKHTSTGPQYDWRLFHMEESFFGFCGVFGCFESVDCRLVISRV